MDTIGIVRVPLQEAAMIVGVFAQTRTNEYQGLAKLTSSLTVLSSLVLYRMIGWNIPYVSFGTLLIV